MTRYFVDSNVVVYANDRRDGWKQKRALNVLQHLMTGGNGALSVHVLQDYAHTALTKLQQDLRVVMRQIKLLECLAVSAPSPSPFGGRWSCAIPTV